MTTLLIDLVAGSGSVRRPRAMLDALPAAARICGCVDTETAADRLPLRHFDRLDRLTRGGMSLPDGVRRLAPEPGGSAYVVGRRGPFGPYGSCW
ncbi:hypothetical protein ACWGH4_05815 [Streptomyces sp. NPDC054847]